jgi:hypothetical protein
MNFMRDEIYLQFARQFLDNSDNDQLKILKDTLEILTRYFPPSMKLVFPLIHFISEQKTLRDSLVRNNLVRFAECYLKLDNFTNKDQFSSMLPYL